MQLGVFSKVFERETLEQVLDAVKIYGFSTMQFNFACAGLASLPDKIPAGLPMQIREACKARGLSIAAVSGTYNMIHPDPKERDEGLKHLEAIAAVCYEMCTDVITICTGSRDMQNMWRYHPDNNTPAAWRDLTKHLEQALSIAETYNLILGVEPEINNVINSAAKARQLLDEMQSKHLGIVLDPANLYGPGDVPDTKGILQEAFDVLGGDIILAHAKDVKASGEFKPAGQGDVDYRLYIYLLKQAKFDGALITHGQSEIQTPEVVDFLEELVIGG